MENINVDALVVGGGIAGMQAALDLADQGYQVALVEKEASIGGKMIPSARSSPPWIAAAVLPPRRCPL